MSSQIEPETKIIKIPAIKEYGEVALLVESKEREEAKIFWPNAIELDYYVQFKELKRIIDGKKYELEFVDGHQSENKPLLIIREI